ncbi:MAG: class A beta-lactamase-related serine hydrolase [Ignavibacteriaceae bacterium]|nr:class A beta-lactamase-related serine hydrolase [Ignavibacteriaceae bacterium]
MRSILSLLVLLVFVGFAQNKKEDKNFLENLLKENAKYFPAVLENPEKHRVQIIYTKIDRTKNGETKFSTYKYHVNAKKYFNPASTIKLPAALLTLEKINQLKIKGLTKETSLRIDSAYTGQTKVEFDSSSQNKLPSLANYIKKLFIVSDNDAYNRLYEFLGQQYFNEKLWRKEYNNVMVHHRFVGGLSREQNRFTNPFTFYFKDKTIYEQPMRFNHSQYQNDAEDLLQGKGVVEDDSIHSHPKDFTFSNYFALEEQHEMLKSLFFPKSVAEEKRFLLTKDDITFLKKYMSILPRESEFSEYRDYSHYPDGYVKYFLYGDTKDSIPDYIKIYNKVGQAYGYLTDNAYIVDSKNKVEFLLSAVIYVNEDEIFNDDKYEYDEIGLPFLANLGRVIYRYELERKNKTNNES